MQSSRAKITFLSHFFVDTNLKMHQLLEIFMGVKRGGCILNYIASLSIENRAQM